MSDSLLHQAVRDLGGQEKTAAIVGRTQSRISDYLKSLKPPAEVCMQIEAATDGKYPAAKLRPDLARVFAAFRKGRA